MEASFGRTPHPETLGYQAALDAGFAIVDPGSSVAALPYFERAVALRPTSIALTQQGKCLRDLGRTDEARVAYRRAVTASGGRGHARVSLIALLVESEEFIEAMELSEQAFAEEPGNPAVLNVYASSIEGLASRSPAGQLMSRQHREALLQRVRDLRLEARELEPEARAEWLQRRRDRTFPVHSIAPSEATPVVSVEQSHTTPLAWGEPAPSAERTTEDVLRTSETPVTPVEPTVATVTPEGATGPTVTSSTQEGTLLVRLYRKVFSRIGGR
ncbi:MAG TPA: hypothetical protein VFT50_02745 [Baekduia sp.]|nr:hypothetical protein [Baekduia sp.]